MESTYASFNAYFRGAVVYWCGRSGALVSRKIASFFHFVLYCFNYIFFNSRTQCDVFPTARVPPVSKLKGRKIHVILAHARTRKHDRRIRGTCIEVWSCIPSVSTAVRRQKAWSFCPNVHGAFSRRRKRFGEKKNP